MRRELHTPRAVRAKIKKLYLDDGLSLRDLRERFGISESTISAIVGRKNLRARNADTLDQAFWPGGRKYRNGRTSS